MIANVGAECAHFALRSARDGVDDLDGVRSGSGKALGWPRVETMFGCLGGAGGTKFDDLLGARHCSVKRLQ